MSISCIIIDDEETARENLSLLIGEFCPQLEISGEADSIESGLDVILSHKPQLVFLDIQLGSRTVFELLQMIGDIKFQIIFVSAFDHFALKAIEFSAIDYLLKPVEIPKLVKAISKATAQIDKNQLDTRLNNLMQNLNSSNKVNHKIALATSEGYEMFQVNDIMYCIADGSYTHFHFSNRGTVIVSKNLKYYQGLLQDYNFNRCHSSCLVNLVYIKLVGKKSGGFIKLDNDKILPISKSSRLVLESHIKKHNRLV